MVPIHSLQAFSLVILRNKDNNLLMLKRGPSLPYGSNLYSIPGGGVEKGETFRQAATREAHEEIGININQDDLKFVHSFYKNNGECEFVAHVFECRNWSGEPFNKEPNKHSDLIWCPNDILPKDSISSHANIINLVERGIFYSEQL